jgi:hypothetical protein
MKRNAETVASIVVALFLIFIAILVDLRAAAWLAAIYLIAYAILKFKSRKRSR